MEYQKKKGIFEVIMAEKLPNFMIDTKSQMQESQRTVSRINTKNKYQNTTSGHIVFRNPFPPK